jgi:hypothetical protein
MTSLREKEVNSRPINREILLHGTHAESIVEAFLAEFEEVLFAEKPTIENVKQVFEWLRQEGQCAITFSEINALNKCRRLSEQTLSKFTWLKKATWRESKSVGRELMRRFEELRTTRKNTKGRIPLFEGQKEEEKALPEH